MVMEMRLSLQNKFSKKINKLLYPHLQYTGAKNGLVTQFPDFNKDRYLHVLC